MLRSRTRARLRFARGPVPSSSLAEDPGRWFSHGLGSTIGKSACRAPIIADIPVAAHPSVGVRAFVLVACPRWSDVSADGVRVCPLTALPIEMVAASVANPNLKGLTPNLLACYLQISSLLTNGERS